MATGLATTAHVLNEKEDQINAVTGTGKPDSKSQVHFGLNPSPMMVFIDRLLWFINK